MKTKIIAEIGINHNGDIELTKRLIDLACVAGCDYVKFQKRNPDVCVPDHQKHIIRDTPWGKMTYLQYKYRVEFGKKEYDEIDAYCREKKIGWFASVWDVDSVEFMKAFKQPDGSVIMKIPSAKITSLDLCREARDASDILLISTGMSTEEEIDTCVNACNPDVIFHTNSTYPSPVSELKLEYITWLRNKYPHKQIGYSGHEYGLVTTFATIALGAEWIERHVTLDRNMWGSDQSASVEPIGLYKLVRGIRDVEASLGGCEARTPSTGEQSKLESLRG